MKNLISKIFITGIIGFLFISSDVIAQKVTITVKSTFKGVQEGYDHPNRNYIYLDGKLVGKSKVTLETENNVKVVKTTAGSHVVRVENWAHYTDPETKKKTWEIHSVENGYSIDCIYKEDVDFSSDRTLTIIFDIDGETSGDWD